MKKYAAPALAALLLFATLTACAANSAADGSVQTATKEKTKVDPDNPPPFF